MNNLFGLMAMTSLVATPALGSVREAAYASSSDRPAAQTSVFAGATYRVGLDRRTGETKGRASLALTGMARSPTDELRFGRGLEISGGRTGKPALLVAGQDVGEMKRKAQLSGTTTAIIVGVLLVGAIVAAVAIHEATKCTEDCAPAGGS